MRKILATLFAALALLVAALSVQPSRAQQQTRAQLLSGLSTCYSTNGQGQITGASMRACMTTLVNSITAIFGDINVIANAVFAQMPANTVKANITGGLANAADVPLTTILSSTPPSSLAPVAANSVLVNPTNVTAPIQALPINGGSSCTTALTYIAGTGFNCNALASTTGISTASYNVSGSALQTTGTISGSSTSLALGAALDFVNGQGILVNHAGAAFTTGQASSVSVSNVGTTGSTTYNYRISTCDKNGGVGIATVAASTATGNANLNITNFNTVAWTPPGGGTCFLIWRSIGAGAYSFYGSTVSTSFQDAGQQPEPLPFWVPTLPPAAALADWLVTTISSGAGSTTLTLGAAATTAASGVFVAHDDTTGMNNWVAAVNGACGLASVPFGSTVRTSAGLNNITCSNVFVQGNGANFLPAGAVDTVVAQGVINVVSPTGATTLNEFYCPEGAATALLNSGVTVNPNAYVLYTQQAPTSSAYGFITPVKSSVPAASITNMLPCPIGLFNQQQTVTIGGTVTNGDVLNVTLLIGGNTYVASTTAGGGDTTATLAHKLATAINSLYALYTQGVQAYDLAGNVAYVEYPNLAFSVTLGQSVTGAATETIALATLTGQNSSSLIVPLTNVQVDRISGDGTNVVGRNGQGYELVRGWTVVNSSFTNIVGSNFQGGAVLSLYQGFNNIASNIQATASGDSGINDISFSFQTELKASNIASVRSSGFGIGIGSNSYFQGVNFSADGAQLGRCIKFNATAQGSLTNANANNCADTGISVTWGTWKVNIANFTASGSASSGSTGNNQGIWFSDSFDRFNNISNGTAVNNAPTDIAIFASDTQNTVTNVTFGTVFNGGFAAFIGGSKVAGLLPPPTLGACTNGSLTTNGNQYGFILGFSGASSSCAVNLPANSWKLVLPICTAAGTVPVTIGSTINVLTGASTVSVNGTFVNGSSVSVMCSSAPL